MGGTTSTNDLDETARLFKAFADPVRLRLLNLLSGDGEVCVCHLHEALELPQPTVSRHLAYLRRNGLVVGRKEGLWVHYRIAKTKVPLQRTLVDCVGDGMIGSEVFRSDRQKLGRIVLCCGDS